MKEKMKECDFKATFENAKQMKDIISAIGTLVDSAMFKITDDRMHMCAMDSSRIAMCSFSLNGDAFSKYSVKGNGTDELKMEVRIGDLIKFFSRSGSEDNVTITFDKTQKLIGLNFEGQTKRGFTVRMTSTIQDENLHEPQLEFNTKVSISTKDLLNGIKDMALISESIQLVSEDDSFKIAAEGEWAKGEIDLTETIQPNCSYTDLHKDISMYALEYMADFMKASSLTDYVKIAYSDNMPVVIQFDLHNSENEEIGYIKYLLAPRIRDEDDIPIPPQPQNVKETEKVEEKAKTEPEADNGKEEVETEEKAEKKKEKKTKTKKEKKSKKKGE